jgi:hypothetical protein
MTAQRRSPKRLDRFAERSPIHRAGVGLVRFLLPIGLALAVGYGLIAASPFLGEFLADWMMSSR